MTDSPLLPTYAPMNVSFSHGEGPWLFGNDGRKYLDFCSGLATSSLGHAHPDLVQILQKQASKLWHVSNLYQIPEQELLAQRLVDASFADKVFFANSGTEATECAVKIARAHHHHHNNPHKHTIITFQGAFHGRTFAALAAGNQERHLAGFHPHLPGFLHIPFNDQNALNNACAQHNAAAVFLEPIQGEGGIRSFSSARLKNLRSLCKQHNLLLIYDEVQTGVGRTGELFAHQLSNVPPDVMTLAKGLGGGFPIAACLASNHAASGMSPGSHGSTFGGNPLACSVALGVLNAVLHKDFLPNVRQCSALLKQSLAELAEQRPDVIQEIRGEGLMLGLKLHDNALPARELAAKCVDQLLLAAPAADNVLRLLPPLVITPEHVRNAVQRLNLALS